MGDKPPPKIYPVTVRSPDYAPRDYSTERWWDRGRPIKEAPRPVVVEPDYPEDEPSPIQTFEPLREHENDLKWYFAVGAEPKELTPKQRERWNRINRCLGGRGHRLFLYYTNPHGFRDRRVAAVLPDDPILPAYDMLERRHRTERGLPLEELKRLDAYLESEKLREPLSYAMGALNVEYDAYTQATVRHYGGTWERYIFMEEESILRAIANGWQSPEAAKDTLIWLILEDHIQHGTWGKRRVSEHAASHILGDFRMPRNKGNERAKYAEDLFRELIARSRRALPKERTTREPTIEINDDPVDFRLDVHDLKPAKLESLGVTGQVLVNDRWDEKRVEKDLGRETTTVDELGKRFRMNSSTIRELLEIHGPEHAAPHTQIPVAWLKSEAGHRFMSEVGRRAGRFSRPGGERIKGRKHKGKHRK